MFDLFELRYGVMDKTMLDVYTKAVKANPSIHKIRIYRFRRYIDLKNHQDLCI